MKTITSKDNQLIISLSKLKDKRTRELEHKFIVEGYHLVDEAFFNHRLEMVLITDVKDDHYDNVDTYLVNEQIIKKLSSTMNPQPIIGIVSIQDNIKIDQLLEKDNVKLILLDDVSDPGNMGTIIRTSAALGYDAVISSMNSVDYYNDKVIRSSEGAIFRIPLLNYNLIELLSQLKKNGINIYTTSLKATTTLDEAPRSSKYGIIFGNESRGVSDELIKVADHLIIIPMSRGVESLNVAVSAGIIMYEMKK